MAIVAAILGIGVAAYYSLEAAPEAQTEVVAKPVTKPMRIDDEPKVVPAPVVAAALSVVATPDAGPEVVAEEPSKPTRKGRVHGRPRPSLSVPGPRRSPRQVEQWQEVNKLLRLHLSEDVAVKAAKLLEDHCIERASTPRPVRNATDSEEAFEAKMRSWAFETRSVGKSSELHQLIPDAETKKKLYTRELIGLLRSSCPTS